MKNREIERKFLVRSDFKSYAYSSECISQGYLCSDPLRTIRVRKKGPEAYITVKGKGSSMSHFEWEKAIEPEEANALLGLAMPGMIEKTRYYVRNTDGIHVWEVDEFHKDNEGLVIAEIELESEDECFDIPDWLGEEVTSDPRYYNSMLSRHPFKTW